MRRRITAWIALLAMLVGVGLPAHAYAHRLAAPDMARDLCRSGDAARSMPATPDRHRDLACDACAGCATPAAPAVARTPAIAPAAYVAGLLPARVSPAAPHVRHFRARAPPASR